MTDVVRTAAGFLTLLESQNNVYARPRATVLQAQLARDLIISLAGLAGFGVLVDGVTYAATTAGVQAAHDSLPATGGNLIIAPNLPIQGSTTPLSLTRPNLNVFWPKSSPFLAPTGEVPYTLVIVGAAPAVAAGNLLTANGLHGDRTVTIASTVGYAKGDWVQLANNAGQLQYNRIRNVVSATVMQLYRPISAPLTMASGSAIARDSALISNIAVEGMHIDNNGNSNPGLISGWTASASTTITVNAAKGATSITLTSAVGFATGDYVLVRDSGQLNGEANGIIFNVIMAGAVASLQGPLPFALSAATATVQNVGSGGSTAQIRGNVGMKVFGTNKAKVTNLTGEYITGPLLFSYGNYEPLYRDVIPWQCGFAWISSNGEHAAAIQSYFDMGNEWDNSYAEDSLSWGSQIDIASQHRGDLGSVSSTARGVKLGGAWDCSMRLWSENSASTGVMISQGSSHNDLIVRADGNAEAGLAMDSVINNDNYIDFHGVNNNAGAGDVSSAATDLRNTIVVHNQDAVVPVNKAMNWVKPIDIPAAGIATYFTSDSGTWVVAFADVEAFQFQMRGNVMCLNIRIITTQVTGTPLELRITLPSAAVAVVTTGSVPCFIVDNGTAAPGLAFIVASAAFITIVREDGAAFATSAASTSVVVQMEIPVA